MSKIAFITRNVNKSPEGLEKKSLKEEIKFLQAEGYEIHYR